MVILVMLGESNSETVDHRRHDRYEAIDISITRATLVFFCFYFVFFLFPFQVYPNSIGQGIHRWTKNVFSLVFAVK